MYSVAFQLFTETYLNRLRRCSSGIPQCQHCFWFDLIYDLIYCVSRHFQQYFSYIMATSVKMVEEAGVPGENHWPWASNW